MSTSTDQVPNIELRNGESIPQLGFGVFQIPPEETFEAVTTAFQTGYRHIDTAKAYRNEAEVGQAFHASGLSREEVFITTKCFNDDHGYEQALKAGKKSLEQLELDHIDLYLIHWPVPSQDKYVETWKALIELRNEGIVRSIGVSNFQQPHLERIIAETGETPAVNQIELHPLLPAAGPAPRARRPRDPHRGLEPAGPGRRPRRPGDRRDRQGPRAHAGSGRAALAHPAREHRVPEVGHAGADRRELRPLRLPPLGVRDGADRRSSTRGERIGPDPDTFVRP